MQTSDVEQQEELKKEQISQKGSKAMTLDELIDEVLE